MYNLLINWTPIDGTDTIPGTVPGAILNSADMSCVEVGSWGAGLGGQ